MNETQAAVELARALTENEKLRQRVGELEKDAERFRALQNMDHVKAQAFFWNYSSRKQRAKAIDAAMESE